MKTHSHLSRIALGSLLASALVTSAQAQFTTYTSPGNGVWSAALNWSNGAPNGAGSIAFVGPHMDAENTRVALNEDVTLDRLLVTDGMHVDTRGNILTVTGNAQEDGFLVTGSNIVNGVARPTRLIVDSDGNVSVLNVEDASFEEGAQLYLSNFGGAVVNVGGILEIDSESSIEGGGFLSFIQNGATIDHNGTIRPETGEMISLRGGVNFTLNLDGSNHTGTLSALAPNSQIVVNGALTDGEFDGTLEIGPGSTIDFRDGVICGINSPARINLASNAFSTAILKVGDDEVFRLLAGSDMDTNGNCLFDGDFVIFNDETTLDIAVGAASRFTVSGLSRLVGGTITVGGTIEFAGGVSHSGILPKTGFVLNGGTVEAQAGSVIAIDGPELKNRLRGHGLWETGVRNDAAIQAEGGLLTIDAENAITDLDGVNDQGVLRATSGDLKVIMPLAVSPYQFAGRAVVGNGHSLTFENSSWDFTEESELILGGDDEDGGILEVSGALTLNGQLEVSANSEIRSTTEFGPDGPFGVFADLLLTGNASFTTNPQTEFLGDGRVKVGKGSSFRLSSQTTFHTQLESEGVLFVQKGIPGVVTVNNRFAPGGDTGTGSLVMDILGRPNTADWDRVDVNGLADLGGTLTISFNVPNAQLGDTWRVIQAESVENRFANFEFTGVPEGMGLVQFESSDGVYVKLVPESLSYLEWANQQGLLINDLAIDANPDGDPMNNLMEMFVGGNPLQAEYDLQPQFIIVEVNGQFYPGITFRQAAHSQVSNVIGFEVEISSGLDDWDFAKAVEVKSEYDPENCVNIWTFRSPIELKEETRQFLRLVLTELKQ